MHILSPETRLRLRLPYKGKVFLDCIVDLLGGWDSRPLPERVKSIKSPLYTVKNMKGGCLRSDEDSCINPFLNQRKGENDRRPHVLRTTLLSELRLCFEWDPLYYSILRERERERERDLIGLAGESHELSYFLRNNNRNNKQKNIVCYNFA